MKTPTVTGISLLRDEIIEDDRHAKLAVGFLVAAAVLKDHEAGRLGRLVLFWHIDPVVPLRCRERPWLEAKVCLVTSPRGRSGLRLGIGAERVIVQGKCGNSEDRRRDGQEEERAHDSNDE